MRSKFQIRAVINLVHRWTGLSIALFLVIVGITGTILAFGTQIDRLLNPELHAEVQPGKAPLPLAAFAEIAEAAYPHLKAAYYSVEGDQVTMMMRARTNPVTGQLFPLDVSHLVLDPWTGKILGSGPMESNWRDAAPLRQRILPFVYSLHTSLAMNTSWAWTFVGVIALIWTIDCLIAIWLTFPYSSGPFWVRFRQAWLIKWNANSARIHFDLHRASGLWLWPLLFIFGWSSVMLGLRQVYEPVTHALFDYQGVNDGIGAQILPKPIETPKLDWRAAQAAGERIMAEQAHLHNFTIERPYGMAYVWEYGAYSYAVRSSIDWRGRGWDTTILIDGSTGRLRELDLPRGQHLGNTISTLLWGIHYGDLRDWLFFRIAIGIFGLVLAMLSYTGFAIWWRKRKVRRIPRRAQAAVVLALIAVVGTARHANAQPAVQPVHLRFAGRLGGQEFSCGKQYAGIGTKPVTVTPADLRFFISDVALIDKSGKAVPVNLDQDGTWQYQNLVLVDLENGKGGCRNGNEPMHEEISGSVPAGNYTGLRFTVGVPFALDHVDASTAPAPLNFTAMNWVWQAGFKFIRAELVVVHENGAGEPSPAPASSIPASNSVPKGRDEMRSGGFPIHIGSTGCASSSKTTPPTEECKHPNRIEVTLTVFDSTQDRVIFDVDKLAAGSDVTTNSPGTAPGCMSGEQDPDCAPVFKALGLPYGDQPGGVQTVFYGEHKQ